MSEEQQDGGPAFPYSALVPDEHRQLVGTMYADNQGMSLRAYIATAALQGILACFKEIGGYESAKGRAEQAVKHADALIAELSK